MGGKGDRGVRSRARCARADWVVNDALTVQQYDTYQAMNELAEQYCTIGGGEASPGCARPTSRTQRRLGREDEERAPVQDDYTMTLTYYWRHGDDNILTPAALQEMCHVENVILNAEGYERVCASMDRWRGMPWPGWAVSTSNGVNCTASSRSILSFFYQQWQTAEEAGRLDADPPPSEYTIVQEELLGGVSWKGAGVAVTEPLSLDLGALPRAPRVGVADDAVFRPGSHERRCQLLDADYVSARSTQLLDIADFKPQYRFQVGFHVAPDALDTGATSHTRSQIEFSELADKSFVRSVRVDLFDYFSMRAHFLYSAFRDSALTEQLKVKFYCKQYPEDEMTDLVQQVRLACAREI